MDFLFVTTFELDALREIPINQRVVYLMGLRPYMDRKTFMVGIKRKISYQSLRETLYVAPIKGVKTGCPSHQQMKRAIKSLERLGIIEIRSSTKNLILKCLLANPNEVIHGMGDSTPENIDFNKLEMNQPRKIKTQKSSIAKNLDYFPKSSTMVKPANNLQDLYKKFEQFWQYYPLPSYKAEAWKQFQRIDPDENLFAKIMDRLHEQLSKSNQTGAYWPYPASWLGQKIWLNK